MQSKVFLSGLFPFSARKIHQTFVLLILLFSLSAISFGADDVQNINPEDTKKLLKQAKKLQRKGHHREAEKILRQVIARHPQHDAAKLDLAYILLKEKRLLEAYNFAYEIAKTDPKNSYAFAILGATFLSAGNFDEARVLLNNARSLNNREALAYAGLGMLYFYENRTEESIRFLNDAVYLDNREPDYIFALAQVAARAEKYRAAAEAYERFLKIAPDSDNERKERIKGLIRFLKYLGSKTELYELAGEKETAVPLKLINNRPVVQLRLKSDEEPLNFVLDTGSGISVISNKTSERLKIKPVSRGGVARALGGDGRFEIVYGFLDTVYIGDVKIRNVPIYIREFHNKNEQIDGYIGLSLISKYVTTIDYGNGSFKLIRTDEHKKREIPPLENGMTVPLRLTSSGFLSGQVKLDGFESPLNFIVDTGASVSVISDELASYEHVKKYILEQRMNVIGAAGITKNVPSFMLPNVTFGEFSRNDLKAIALDLDLINETSGFEQAGILGGNFLKNYSLTFDFEQSKVTFVPNIIKREVSGEQ
jgi:tetratricopeptide (TPR) repeat protein/predicted aspartyl protease